MEWNVGYWQISVQRTYPTSAQLSRMYNAAAPSWNRLVHDLGINRAYVELFRSLQKAHLLDNVKGDSTVCDCGIGTAAFSLALVKAINLRINIVGADISQEMLNQAQQSLNQANISQQLYQADVNNLPFDDNTFDLVISAHMLEHLPHPIRGLQEMMRVLRPGAPLLLAVTRPGLLGWWIQWHWGNNCLSEAEVTAMMTKIELRQIRSYPLTTGLSRWASTAYVGFKP